MRHQQKRATESHINGHHPADIRQFESCLSDADRQEELTQNARKLAFTQVKTLSHTRVGVEENVQLKMSCLVSLRHTWLRRTRYD